MNIEKHSAVATSVIALVIVVLVAVAAAGVYFATSGGGSTSTTSSSSSSVSSSSQASSTSQSTSTSTSSTSSASSTTTSHSTSSTQSTPTTSSSTSTSSSSSTQQTSSVSCGTTTTTTTSSTEAQIQVSIIPLLQAASNLTVAYSGVSNGTSFNFRASYQVESAQTSSGVTTFKVNIAFTANGQVQPSTAWVDSNGNVIAVDFGGFNATGSSASSIFLSFMSPFIVEANYNAQLEVFTSGHFSVNGTSTETFGSTSLQLTSYQAVNVPETFTECGTTFTITAFGLKVGPIQGTSVNLIAYMHLEGSENGQSVSFTLAIVWVTKT